MIKGIGEIHQTFLPKGQLGALDENPYKLDVAKAKELLAKAGVPDGFSITMDVRNNQPVTGIAESMQQTLAQAGVKMEIIPGDGKQTLTKYRARTHDMYIGQWGSDYFDPNSNADTFTGNPDNSDAGTVKTLAWRNTGSAGARQASQGRTSGTRRRQARRLISGHPEEVPQTAPLSSSSSRPRWPATARA